MQLQLNDTSVVVINSMLIGEYFDLKVKMRLYKGECITFNKMYVLGPIIFIS